LKWLQKNSFICEDDIFSEIKSGLEIIWLCKLHKKIERKFSLDFFYFFLKTYWQIAKSMV
jgi:hypothetical protein